MLTLRLCYVMIRHEIILTLVNTNCRRKTVALAIAPTLSQVGHDSVGVTDQLPQGLTILQSKIPRQISFLQQGSFAGGNCEPCFVVSCFLCAVQDTDLYIL